MNNTIRSASRPIGEAISRRGFLAAGAAGATALLAERIPLLAGPGESGSGSSAEEFTFVHLTDMHVTPRRWGDRGYRRCVESVLDLRPRPAFAIMGGDLAFDGLYTPKPVFEEQIRLYREITSALAMPNYPCMGNHDALGLSARRKVAADDPEFGKKMIMDRLEWEKSYYSFDHGEWHFVVLDSIFPIPGEGGLVYEPRIGREQLEWLAHDLGRAAGRPTVAVTHIAAFCNIAQTNGDREKRALDGNLVLWDTKDLRLVLERHKVKALLQGHTHRVEEQFVGGVHYVTSAAVSGAWWAGNWQGYGPGYTVCTCRGDRLTWEHKTFAWEPHLEPEDNLERARLSERAAFLHEQEYMRTVETSKRRNVETSK